MTFSPVMTVFWFSNGKPTSDYIQFHVRRSFYNFAARQTLSKIVKRHPAFTHTKCIIYVCPANKYCTMASALQWLDSLPTKSSLSADASCKYYSWATHITTQKCRTVRLPCGMQDFIGVYPHLLSHKNSFLSFTDMPIWLCGAFKWTWRHIPEDFQLHKKAVRPQITYECTYILTRSIPARIKHFYP